MSKQIQRTPCAVRKVLLRSMIRPLAGLGCGAQAPAQNAITDWHAVMESTVAASGRKNAVALPYYAYVDVAMYDAVSAIRGPTSPLPCWYGPVARPRKMRPLRRQRTMS